MDPSFNNFLMVSVTGEVIRGQIRPLRVILKPKLERVAALGGKELTPWIALGIVFKMALSIGGITLDGII